MLTHRSKVTLAIAAAAAALALCAPILTAQVSALRSQRESVYSRIRAAKGERAEASAEAEAARAELRRCEQRLVQAQRELESAKQRVLDTREEIRATEIAVHQTELELERQKAVGGQRMLAMHKSGNVQYVSVLIGASDFTEMASRAYLFETLAQNDADMVARIDQKRRETEVKKLDLEKQRTRLEEDKKRIQEAQTRIAAETERQKALTAKLQAEVDRITGEIDSLLATSEQLTSQIKNWTAGPSAYQGRWSGPWTTPCNGPITSGFGYRVHPIARVRRMHTGIDISAPSGTPIRAAGGGKVISAGWRGGYGNCIIVDHGGGSTTLYAHLSGYAVSSGAVVSAGQTIGYCGSTGYSTGPHLHFEVRKGGAPVNPLSNAL